MNSEDALKRYLARLERSQRHWARRMGQLESLAERAVKELTDSYKQSEEAFRKEEIQLKSQLDQAGKEYAQKKYQMEKETTLTKADFERTKEEYEGIHKKYGQELLRVEEQQTQLRISYERQKSALTDLYQEKQRSLTVSNAKLVHEWKMVEEKLDGQKTKGRAESESLEREWNERISALKDQAAAKREGWAVALEAMRKNLETLTQEKAHLEKRLAEIKGEKEKELEAAQTALAIAREQLEVDKATLIEKAEEDQRRCETEVAALKDKIETGEKELQNLILSQGQRAKDAEEAFQKEEQALKDALKNESEKRDYEQKLFEQEKVMKEKEIARLQENYEKRKWQWDNQIRTLLMQKSVQDAEFEAERMRVDREARVAVRALEAKRDELRQRLGDLKARHQSLTANAAKEQELLQQRWQWRKDRLWSMWQNRLDVIRKERAALNEQLEHISEKFGLSKTNLAETENREEKKIEDLQKLVIQGTDRQGGQRKQKEIELELEKTRIIAQIKECEQLVADWMERLRLNQDQVAKRNLEFTAQLNYLDQWYRDEEKETELFLQSLQKALSLFDAALDQTGAERAA